MIDAPAFIPSKGRPHATTARLLEAAGVAFRLVVEPQDAPHYLQAHPSDRLCVLGADDQGLAFARNAILDRARKEGIDWFWMLDDDISGFYRVSGRRCVPCPASEALAGAFALFSGRSDTAIGSLEYQQFAWSAARPAAINGYCDVAVCIHATRTAPARYRGHLVPKEDRDFTLQVLAGGWGTFRAQRFAFACPKNGSNAGGLAPVYADPGREAEAVRKMCDAWGPDICRPTTKRAGRRDVSINWRFFRPRPSRA